MMIPRALEAKLLSLATLFPVVAVLGPRQSGKTTVAQHIFRHHAYVSLEDVDVRLFAREDPRGFIQTQMGPEGLIIDEIQHVPELFSYIQTHVDKEQKPGLFILTGSQNFLLHEKIAQSLAGRVALTTLLPLSSEELQNAGIGIPSMEEALFLGGYPRIHAGHIPPTDWYPNYIRTYLERDLRQMKNVSDLDLFAKFVRLCAGRVGQLLNLSSLGNDCGISTNTARSWISLLEQSFILFLLQPYHENFNKRLVKMPKIYFYDTGIACSLLQITAPKELVTHHLRGGLFESFVLSEIYKMQLHRGMTPYLTFWRDKTGHEVDGIIEIQGAAVPLEIKAAQTISTDFFKGLTKWKELAKSKATSGYLIYAGRQNQTRAEVQVLSWDAISKLKDIFIG